MTGRAIILAITQRKYFRKSFNISTVHGEGIGPPMDHFDRYPDRLGAHCLLSTPSGSFVRELWPLEPCSLVRSW
jgi:hypothetical protein